MNKKILKKKLLGNGWTALDLVEEEFNVLKILKHPNVIYLHEIINDPNDKNEDIYLITEYHSNGSIGDLLKKINLPYEDFNFKNF